ncbi:MAG: response regulator [Myxococcaceae bacterium]|nr:response regulator [Myxococcaceae bacterium]
MSGPPVVGSKSKILIVDDDPNFLAAIGRMLRGDHVVSTEVLASAVCQRLHAEGPFDLILCDLHMPQVDGPGLHRLICEQFPHYRSRFVFFTGGLVTQAEMGFWSRPDVPRVWKHLRPDLMRQRIAEHVARVAPVARAG